MDECLSPKQIAGLLNVSERTARKYLRLMPHYTLPGGLRVKRSDFDRWLGSLRCELKADPVVMEILRDIAS